MLRFLPHQTGAAVGWPGVYFRLLLIGFLKESAASAASAGEWPTVLACRRFLNYGFEEATPDQ